MNLQELSTRMLPHMVIAALPGSGAGSVEACLSLAVARDLAGATFA